MNPFKQVAIATLERGESSYNAINAAKVLYADHVRGLARQQYSDEFTAESLAEYTRMLDEALAELSSREK